MIDRKILAVNSVAVFVFFINLISTYKIFSQQPGVAHLSAVQGNDFTIISGGQEHKFSAQQLLSKSLYFNNGDAAQTGSGSYMDISLVPGGPEIKLAENTSFVINGLAQNKGLVSVTLIYGRILVKCGKSGSPISVQTGSSATEISNGTINIDYTVLPFVQPQGRPTLLVSAFEGQAAILPSQLMPEYGRFVVKKGNSIMIDPFMNHIERIKVDKTLAEYWNKRQMQSSSYTAKYEPNIRIEPQQPVADRNQNDMIYIVPYKADRVDSKVRSAGIATGLALMLLGVAAQGAMHFMENSQIEKRQSDMIFYSGFAPIGIGAFILAASSTYKPRETIPVPAVERDLEKNLK